MALPVAGEELMLAELEVKAFEALEVMVAAPAFLGTLEQAAGMLHRGIPPAQPQPTLRRRTFLRWGKGSPQEVELQHQPTPAIASTPPSEPVPVMSDEPAASSSGSIEAANAPFCLVDCAPSASDQPHPADEEFVVVQKGDAVEAMAFYLASVLMELPQAQQIPPAELQKALTQTLAGLKKSKFKQVCAWGRQVYRWGTITSSALQMYQNPWLVQAVITALWYVSRTALRMAI